MIFTTKAKEQTKENFTQIEIKTYKLIKANKQEACMHVCMCGTVPRGSAPKTINWGALRIGEFMTKASKRQPARQLPLGCCVE